MANDVDGVMLMGRKKKFLIISVIQQVYNVEIAVVVILG